MQYRLNGSVYAHEEVRVSVPAYLGCNTAGISYPFCPSLDRHAQPGGILCA